MAVAWAVTIEKPWLGTCYSLPMSSVWGTDVCHLLGTGRPSSNDSRATHCLANVLPYIHELNFWLFKGYVTSLFGFHYSDKPSRIPGSSDKDLLCYSAAINCYQAISTTEVISNSQEPFLKLVAPDPWKQLGYSLWKMAFSCPVHCRVLTATFGYGWFGAVFF